jgi:hypothetical protein
MPNTTTQAIILKDFTGGIWLNEGEPPDNTYSSFESNLDPLPGGGVQKRQPVRLNYKVLSGSNFENLWWVSALHGPMQQWLQADPTNGLRYVVVDWYGAAAANIKMKCFDRTTSTIVWTAALAMDCRSFDYASSDAGSNWYTHNLGGTNGAQRITTAGVKTNLTLAFNDNIGAPTNGNMPAALMGVQHLAAYYFVGNTYEGGTNFQNRIRWSHPGRFEDYRTNDKLDVGDKSNILGLYSVNDTLLIVKETSLWVLTGYDPDTFQLRKIADISANSVNGTIARTAGCSHAQFGAYFYVEKSGVFQWDGSKLTDVSGGLRDAIQDGRITMQHMQILGDTVYCSGGQTQDLVFGGISAADANTDLSWQYNTRTKAWTQHNAGFVGLAPIQAAATGSPKGYAVHQHGTNGGYSFSFYRQQVAAGSWQDNQYGSNSAIVCQYRSPWQDARNPARKKRWRRVFMVWNKRPNASASDPVNYTMTVFKNWDGVHSTKTATTALLKATDTTDYDSLYGYGHAATGSDFDEPDRLSSLGNAYAVQVLLSSTGTPADQWGFDSLTFKYVPRSLR